MTRLPQGPLGDDRGGDDEPKTMSLLTGVANAGGMSDAEILGADKSGRGGMMNQTAMLIAGAVVVAAGAIYGLSLTQGELAAGANKDAETKIENYLVKLTKPAAMSKDDPLQRENLQELFQDTDAIVAMFASDPTEHQVPVDQLQKNPFELPGAKTTEGTPVVETDRERDQRVAQLKAEFAKLSLQTVMVSGSRQVAIINGEFYQPGQKVGSFTVAAMDPLRVQLKAEGETFVLTLQQDPNAKKR